MAFEGMTGVGLTTPGGGSSDATGMRVAFTRGSIKYDSPFLDMTSTFLPRSIKSILRFISAYVVSDGLVAQCITKMSEYPITDILYNDTNGSTIKDDKTLDKWKKILEGKVNIIRSMKQSGMDYYAYGNSIVSINYPFKRMLKCPKCKTEHSSDGMNTRFVGFDFFATCATPGCKYKGKMTARDVNTKEVSKLSIVHWDLIYMDIKYNNITGDHFYFFTVPADMAAAIRRGDMDIINGTRLEVIQAVKNRKQLKLMADNVFHLKRSAPQYLYPSERGWGIPVVMPVLKDIFHCKILKKGNEMIALDHIVPLRIIFPQGTGDVSPHATINLSGWKTQVEDEIRKWKADPNYISIVPLPIGMQNFSGDQRILSVTPELKATQDEIITGIGIIPEIIRGGASWSGSNVSLRVVENTFINHRSEMHGFMDFVKEGIRRFLDIPNINIKMSNFKMADDLEKKKLMVDTSRGSKVDAIISKKTITKELGFDPDEEYENMIEELKRLTELRIKEAEGAAEAQGSGQLISASFEAGAQIEQQDRMETHQRELQAKRDEESTAMRDQNAGAVEQEVSTLAQSKGRQIDNVTVPNLIMILTQRFARLAQIDREEFKIRMLAVKNSMPSLYQEIYNNLREMNLIEADTQPNLAEVQKYTPGEIPSYMQGDQYAEQPPGPAEGGADLNVVEDNPPLPGVRPQAYNNPMPEVRAPRSANSPY